MKCKKKIGIILIVAVVVALLLMAGAWLSRYLITGRTGIISGIEWYDENKKEFTLTTAEQLYEFAELSYFYNFEGQTIKLGADIVVNEGNAEDWANDAPRKKWFPIDGFAGTFDGQGHSISGIYCKLYDMEMGLFSDTQESCIIRDFRLLNSYFCSSGSMGTGSISSVGGGFFEKIYSDAIVVSEGAYSAGIIGIVSKNTTISECWFDGSVTTEGRFCGGIVGLVKHTQLLMEHCLNSGDVTSSYTMASATVGGFCGLSQIADTCVEIKDCLNVGVVLTENPVRVGAALGGVGTDTNVKVSSSFVESKTYGTTIGMVSGNLTGGFFQMEEETLCGTNAYKWTTLDFDNYWSCVENETPILQHFSKNAMSVNGIQKGYDISWYEESASEYVITTREQLYGMALLSGETDYAGKIVKLGNDIIINDGKASDWVDVAPKYNWIPAINFSGIFDGQGHAIKGLYQKGESYIALFAKTTSDSMIQNLKLTNSYLCATTTGNAYVASIVARGGGILDTIYSDAIIESTGSFSGGLVGQFNVNADTNKITNCWFNGSIKTSGRGVGGIISSVSAGVLNMEHCLNSGSLDTTYIEGSARAGGLIGYLTLGTGEKTVLNITDCMNTGRIVAKNDNHVGSILGRASDNTEIYLTDVYASKESYKQTVRSIAEETTLSGTVYTVAESGLIGLGGYQRTSLDFDNYWAIVTDGMPILKGFASKISSIPKNLERTIVADTTWYSADKNTFTINTAAQLIGLSVLSEKDDFKGKTIKLGADITINNGNASSWSDKEPITQWRTIGKASMPFAGTFDGQGYTVSGISYTGENTIGMFGALTAYGTIKNFKLVNSYFCGTDDNAMYMGSIVARGGGIIDSVYSDAIMTSTVITEEGGSANHYLGGIIGCVEEAVSKNKNQITNCWFDGYIDSSARNTGGIVGGVLENKDKSATVGLTIQHCLSSADFINNTFATGAARSGGIGGYISGAQGKVDVAVIDSLNVSTLKSVNSIYTCSVFGRVSSNTQVVIDQVYVSEEACSKVNETSSGTTTGNAVSVKLENLKGYDGYQRTLLDFEKYWAIVLTPATDTPILQTFAKDVPKITELERTTTVDTSWYDASKNTYIIDTVAELYGIAELSKDTDFKGKTIKLGADLIVNSGDVEEFENKLPLNQWSVIGNAKKPFAGTFDGQGHSISKIYCTGENLVGLFGCTTSESTIKNLQLLESYFCGSDDNAMYMGSIVARGGGIIDSVYSNAIMISATATENGNSDPQYVGGIIGLVDSIASKEQNVITNCCFEGTILSSARQTGGIVAAVLENTDKSATLGLTIEHCLSSSNEIHNTFAKGASRSGGIGGYISGTQGKVDVTVIDSLSVSTMESVNNIYTCSVFGRVSSNTQVLIDRVYAAKESCSKANETSSGTTTGAVVAVEDSLLKGYEGYINTELEFDNVETETLNDGYWVAKPNGSPELRSFTDLNDITDLSVIVIASTKWYTDAKDDEQGNAPGTNENPYIIHNAADLYGFEQLVNDGTLANKDIVVKLDASFVVNQGSVAEWKEYAPVNGWTPIGKSVETMFTGTFDGQGNTIKGIYCTGNDIVGLFGVTSKDTVIKNLILEESYFSSNDSDDLYIGSIVGYGGGNIESVYSNATIVTTATGNTTNPGNDHYVGGIIGLVNIKDENVINNCWFAGSINTIGRQVGGFVGGINNASVSLTVTHSLSAATEFNVSHTAGAPRIGGFCGYVKAQLSIDDCLNTSVIQSPAANKNYVAAMLGRLAEGTATINNSYAITGTWTRALDKSPSATVTITETINGTTTTLTDYSELLVAKEKINSKALDFVCYWEKTENTPILKYKGVEVPRLTIVIGNETELRQLAEDINSGLLANRDMLVKLSRNIDVDSNSNWIPIGNSIDKAFAGTFDGQGYTISGIHCTGNDIVGLFGVTTNNSVIKNLKIEESYFGSNDSDTLFIGSIVGQGGGSIQSVYSSATIITTATGNTTNPGNDHYVGGIIGYVCKMDGVENQVNNCWFAGSINTIGRQVGGFVGGINNTAVSLTVTHSLSAATEFKVTHTAGAPRIGGFCGYVKAQLSVNDCLNTSVIQSQAANTNYVAAMLGRLAGGTATINNSYAITGTWTRALDKSPSATVTITETIDGTATTLTDYSKLLVATTNINNKSLDFANYWEKTEHTPILKYKGVEIPNMTQIVTLFSRINSLLQL